MSTKTQHTPAEDPVPSDQDIRPAGPEDVNPPKEWKPEDQTSDESFPASDPPGTY